MNTDERITLATTCGVLQVVRALVEPKVAEILAAQEEILWAMIDAKSVKVEKLKLYPELDDE